MTNENKNAVKTIRNTSQTRYTLSLNEIEYWKFRELVLGGMSHNKFAIERNEELPWPNKEIKTVATKKLHEHVAKDNLVLEALLDKLSQSHKNAE